ncbi:GL11182 [Drosophila persimilis]|uniref:GL11182 n=1 Tax=Drosophila persimilis TaxID=7234 RepID=B4GCZ6_DROPE|nr:GL11182 [Drosophila persimilis]
MSRFLLSTRRLMPQQDFLLAGSWVTTQFRGKTSTPMNTVVMFVPQQEAWVVERMGRFHRILDPGLNVLVPIADKIKYVQSLKEIAIDVPKQSAITSDNVTLDIDGVLYLRIIDPYRASYGVEDPEFAITQLAQTTMRSELGKMSLDKVFRERESLNVSIVDSINKASEAWGIACLRYEIRDIRLPTRVHEAMQMQVEAERRKRAAILESEGVREAEINIAEGKRKSRILASEAERQEHINKASGEAAAIIAVADARARSLQAIAKSLAHIYEKRLLQGLGIPEASGREHSDLRCIPSRARNNWERNYHLTADPNPVIAEQLHNSPYACLLRNELLDSEVSSIDECKRSKNILLDTGDFTEKENIRVFGYGNYTPPNKTARHPFSRISEASRRLLCSPTSAVRRITRLPYKVLDAPELQDDFYLNALDWSSKDILGVGLGCSLYLWSAVDSQVTRLCDLSDEDNLITAVKWHSGGKELAVGTNHGSVAIWDVNREKQISSLSGHISRVTALDWRGNSLASGSRDRSILQRDIRTNTITSCLQGHSQEDGKNAASLTLAEQYIGAFKQLAKTNNTMILPSNAADVNGFVAQALAVYNHVSSSNQSSIEHTAHVKNVASCLNTNNIEYNQMNDEKKSVKMNIE